MPALTRFEKSLCNELTDRTGHRVTRREVLAWDVSKAWIEKIKAQDEEAVFLPGMEVWCLVKGKEN